MNNNYNELLNQLESAIDAFIAEVNKKKLTDWATDEWNVKDVLGHICYWHLYYAQQYQALALGQTPHVHDSLAGKNELGRKKMRLVSKKQLINDVYAANELLRKSIINNGVSKMRYMKSREYTTLDSLDVIITHIQRHTVQVRRAK